ncbi:hypothetical protein OHA70_01630 [Kribbella sp. NBC_00382]|uniref:hypothetical protein n=1 Tax=Kribbella sp. NBC_00382 TaxID=2975967 RepID=UPI002E23FB23
MFERWRRGPGLSKKDLRDLKHLRAYNEKEEQARRARRAPLEDLPPLVRELVGLGQATAFREGTAGHRRAREIGGILNEAGGIGAMRDAYELVADWIPQEVHTLQSTWNGVGDWQA